MHSLFSQDPYGWLSYESLCQFPLLRRLRVHPNELYHILRIRSNMFVLDKDGLRRDFDRFPNQEILNQLRTKSTDDPHGPSVIDKRTVYIENLPLELTSSIEEELQFQFPSVTVKYVSVPRHPVTGESFGCAIVELESEREAAIVVKRLRRVDCEKFDAITGELGRKVRVLSYPKYMVLKRMYSSAKSLAVLNRVRYYNDNIDNLIVTQDENLHSPDDDDPSISTSSTSSVLVDSDINSLAQDSVEIRRARNPSSIRSNSIVFISNLPPTSSLNLRVWISHSCAVQFLDHKDQGTEAYVRFASKRERDFFLTDFQKSQMPLLGVIPSVRALTESECLDYFDAERERRRAQCLAMGPPDQWEAVTRSAKKQRVGSGNNVTSSSSVLKVVGETKEGKFSAFTDTVAGNAKQAEPGTSALFGIKEGRHVARKFFGSEEIDSTKRLRTGEESQPAPRKKTRRGTRGGRRR